MGLGGRLACVVSDRNRLGALGNRQVDRGVASGEVTGIHAGSGHGAGRGGFVPHSGDGSHRQLGVGQCLPGSVHAEPDQGRYREPLGSLADRRLEVGVPEDSGSRCGIGVDDVSCGDGLGVVLRELDRQVVGARRRGGGFLGVARQRRHRGETAVNHPPGTEGHGDCQQ